MTLLQMINFLTPVPHCDFHSPVIMDFSFSSDASIYSTMASPLFGNSDHVVVSVSTDFPSHSTVYSASLHSPY